MFAPASKKAEIIVTLAGTASEAINKRKIESLKRSRIQKTRKILIVINIWKQDILLQENGGYEKHHSKALLLALN